MNHSLSETREGVCKVFFFFLTLFCQPTRTKNTFRNASKEVDLKFVMEALMGEMRKVLRAKMEQAHEQIDQVENAHME